MITNFLFTILITLMNLIFGLLDNLLPTISEENMNLMYDYIDSFFNILKMGINGFKFIAGPLPFMLGGTILFIYTFYYTIFIPIRFILRFFFKGK